MAQKCKQPKCTSTNEWINNMWHTHAMEHHSTIQLTEVLRQEILYTKIITCMNLKNIVVNENSPKEQIYVHTYYEMS